MFRVRTQLSNGARYWVPCYHGDSAVAWTMIIWSHNTFHEPCSGVSAVVVDVVV